MRDKYIGSLSYARSVCCPPDARRKVSRATLKKSGGFSVGGEPCVDQRHRLIDHGVAHAELRSDQLHEAVGALDVGGAVVEGAGRRGRPHQVVCGGGVFLERHQVIGLRTQPLADPAYPIVDRSRGRGVAMYGVPLADFGGWILLLVCWTVAGTAISARYFRWV